MKVKRVVTVRYIQCLCALNQYVCVGFSETLNGSAAKVEKPTHLIAPRIANVKAIGGDYDPPMVFSVHEKVIFLLLYYHCVD